jgi:MFS family permease
MKASSVDAKSHGGAAPTAGSSAWPPFRSPDFARMASAQFVSNIGSWMQTVGAQELMLTLTTSATMVALIQTAAGLPVVLLSVPAGASGDLVDRRRLLIASQSFMLIAALLMAGLAFAGLVTPLILLALIFAVGIGQTLTSPVWQTLQPELVAPEDRTQAISLGAVNMNLSRAIGPAVGGALYAASSAAVLFLVNALSFVPVIGAVARWRGRPRPASAVAREHVLRQLALGAAADRREHAAASRLRRLRAAARWCGHRSGRRRAGAAASARAPDDGSPHGGGAVGSAAFGAIAQNARLTEALLAAAIGLALVAVTGIWLPFKAISPHDLLPAGDWPAPHLVDAAATDGPLQVTVEYWPRPGRERDLVDALYAGRHARRRTGAISWRVWRDAANPGRVLEQFVVGSWEEHLRQHERVSIHDQQRLDEIKAMIDPTHPTTVTHWLAPQLDRNPPTTPRSDASD